MPDDATEGVAKHSSWLQPSINLHSIKLPLKAGRLSHAVGKQMSIPLINRGENERYDNFDEDDFDDYSSTVLKL